MFFTSYLIIRYGIHGASKLFRCRSIVIDKITAYTGLATSKTYRPNKQRKTLLSRPLLLTATTADLMYLLHVFTVLAGTAGKGQSTSLPSKLSLVVPKRKKRRQPFLRRPGGNNGDESRAVSAHTLVSCADKFCNN